MFQEQIETSFILVEQLLAVCVVWIIAAHQLRSTKRFPIKDADRYDTGDIPCGSGIVPSLARV